MNTLEFLPFILFIVVIVTSISERINVPYPLLLVIAGLIVGFIPGIPNWHPPSDVVLPIFLPPILFSAARLISWRDIRSNLTTIGSLSIVLVIVTTLAIALVVGDFVPEISLGAALVLGAIISPTDTVAATAILSKMNVRQHIIRSIEVESLFNDATGIVLYKMALAFIALGSMKFGAATWDTFVIGFGGIAVGLMFAYFTSLIVEEFLADSENELPIIMSLILAYVSYLFADRIGVSGVLAVVAAGLFHKKTESKIVARTRLSETAVWDTLIFFLNGIVFITIGVQFPNYLKKVSYIPNLDLVLFSAATIAALILLRVFWVSLTAYLPYLAKPFLRNHTVHPVYSFKKILIVSWAGMRGLVSLALAIALPITLGNNIPFQYRDLIIFLTIITILFTLLVQGLTLPALIKKLNAGVDDKKENKKIMRMYQKLTKAAIENMKNLQEKGRADHYSQTALKLVENYYANRLLQFSVKIETEEQTHEIAKEAQSLLGKILHQERQELASMRKQGELSEEMYIKILRKFDRDEVGFASYK